MARKGPSFGDVNGKIAFAMNSNKGMFRGGAASLAREMGGQHSVPTRAMRHAPSGPRAAGPR